MGRRLNATVYLQDEEGVVRGFGPGDIVPDWVAEQITNPDVWVDDDPASPTAVEDDGDDTGPPPKTGKGSGVQAWREYAGTIGVAVPEDATRDDIIAAVEAH